MSHLPRSALRHLLHCAVFASVALAFGVQAAPPAPTKPVPVLEVPVAPPAPASPLVKVADGRLLAPDIARIVNRGELIVAMLGVDSPPFFYVKNNELVGLEVDLAKAIAKELKVTVRFDRSAQTFNEVVAVVARQEADLGISKLSRTLARAQTISFTDPYLRLNHAFILNRVKFAELARDRPLPTVIRGFKGSIGVIAKSSFADYATKNFPEAEIREYPSWGEVLKALEKGQVMAAYRDEFEIKRLLKIDPTVSLTLRTVTFRDLEDSLGIAVGIQDPTLLAFVNQFLAEGTEKLTIDKVLKAVSQ
ncbi:ABC transporter substrate-binding protein [uncultured Rhodoferax sp.]|uniref:ABC transporter substrate-binding protein n=1 Tax=uncultured Rhodoferax sp. TaxID=223188 RepID=UPI0025FAB944|nr:ABC transporter substrate-binding protein [uncultured Rhodoferax sp.]